MEPKVSSSPLKGKKETFWNHSLAKKESPG